MRYYHLFILALLLVPCVSAELLITQPQPLYNRGDLLQLDLTVTTQTQKSDFLVVSLRCDSDSVEIYRSVLTLAPGASQALPFDVQLDAPVAASLKGTCTVNAQWGSDSVTGQSFTLSDRVILDSSVSSAIVNPAESLTITGTARKENGEALNGFVRARWDEGNTSSTGLVSSGSFSINLTLPPLSAPRDHTLVIEVYDTNSGGTVLNLGRNEETIVVRAVLSRFEVGFTESEAVPSSTFRYTFSAYDQVGATLDKDVRYDIYMPDGTRVVSRLAKTGITEDYALAGNATPGYWRIEGSIEDTTVRKLFYVREFEQAGFEVVNETLFVRNLGNVLYNHTISIVIGNQTVSQAIELAVNQLKRYKLRAPEAMYTVAVSDGTSSVTQYNVPLTGRAIDIGEISDSFFNMWWAGGFILIVVALLFGMNYFRGKGLIVEPASTFVPRTGSLKGIPSAPARAHVSGVREQATILALKAGESMAVDNALALARQAGAAVTSDGSHHVAIFSQRLTKKLENDSLALQTAHTMASMLAEDQETSFGIAVGSGTIISDAHRDGAFSSLGASIPSTKRLASASKGEVLISEELYTRVRTAVRAEKVSSLNAWRLNEIINRDQHKSFIDGFLRRHKK